MPLMLFLLTRPDISPGGWYREARAFLIAADDEKEAREIAASHIRLDSPCCRVTDYGREDERDREAWLTISTCEIVGSAVITATSGIIITDHNGDT